ncbi:proline iminopeptidase [Klebsormidium nitens]|uniref:Proline iminopeptidase n=1 Tax=Klebsormidium nitens TaxID=105231 RepID=A0A0U9HUB8_KLENI|nr:proline iminopeptidase [Klebsormidium nitens]|eukprot:GAQ81262.1 proline iminopeptidase [Klebsormidium nitens]
MFLGGGVLSKGVEASARMRRKTIRAFSKSPPAVETSTETLRTLYSSSKSHKQGHLKVSNLHTIYYEVFGNPKGRPAVFLHGGPGAGCTANHSRFFDPEHYRIVLFDQRGCGKSTPRGCLEENNTWELVEDLEKLRKELDIEKWLVVGGSWGTTLALAYAQTHPERVSAMVLRAVCMMRKREIDWFYKQGADALFPFAWKDYVAHIPEAERDNLLGAYYRRLTSDDRQVAEAAARSWLRWEFSLLSFSNVPVVIAWDGKDYKMLPIPVAAASPTDPAPAPASVATPSNPVASPAVTSGVNAKSDPSPSSNGSATSAGKVETEAGVKEATSTVSSGVSDGTNTKPEPSSGASDSAGTAVTAEVRNGLTEAVEGTTGASDNNRGVEKEDKSERQSSSGEASTSSSNGTSHAVIASQSAEKPGSDAVERKESPGGNGGAKKQGAGKSTTRGADEATTEAGNGHVAEYRPSAENMRGGDWMSSSLAQARLESHYSMNGAFLSEEQLLRGVNTIRSIPTVAVQGRYDFVCPLKTAFDLHSAWPEMELRVVPNAGHSQYETGISHEIILATEKFRASIIRKPQMKCHLLRLCRCLVKALERRAFDRR